MEHKNAEKNGIVSHLIQIRLILQHTEMILCK